MIITSVTTRGALHVLYVSVRKTPVRLYDFFLLGVCVSVDVGDCMHFQQCRCVFDICVLNQLLFWLRIKTTERKCEAKSQIIGPY